MSQKDKLNLCYQISLAVKELHSFQIVHTDIKPHNMLYTGEKVKLIDFNASVKLGNNCEIVSGKREQGTPGYMAKEMYKGDISYQADIYALGVTMLEVWFGDIWPHQTDRYDKNRRYVLDYLSLLKDDHPQLHQLIKQCVSVKKKKPSIEMVVNILILLVNNLPDIYYSNMMIIIYYITFQTFFIKSKLSACNIILIYDFGHELFHHCYYIIYHLKT